MQPAQTLHDRTREQEARSTAAARREMVKPPVRRLPQFDRSWVFLFLLSPVLLGSVGCNSLPAGSTELVQRHSTLPRRGEVYLLRGWRGLWSEGIDQLAKEIRAQGIEARVYRESQSSELGDALLDRFRKEPKSEPIVLIGFSYGADESINLARRLVEAKVPVDLLITLDPVTPAKIPTGIGKQISFYQSNGALDVFPWLRGVPVEGDSASVVVLNIDIRGRPDLQEESTSHATIAGNAKLHRVIVDEVVKVCPPR